MPNNRYEQTFCSKLGKWWDNEGYKLFDYNIKIEAKISLENKPFNFKSGFKPHQIPTMIAYSERPMHWKPSDAAMSTQHYDLSCDQPKYTKGIIAIHWVRKGNKTFYMISPHEIQMLIDEGYKSIDEGMANIICDFRGEIK